LGGACRAQHTCPARAGHAARLTRAAPRRTTRTCRCRTTMARSGRARTCRRRHWTRRSPTARAPRWWPRTSCRTAPPATCPLACSSRSRRPRPRRRRQAAPGAPQFLAWPALAPCHEGQWRLKSVGHASTKGLSPRAPPSQAWQAAQHASTRLSIFCCSVCRAALICAQPRALACCHARAGAWRPAFAAARHGFC